MTKTTIVRVSAKEEARGLAAPNGESEQPDRGSGELLGSAIGGTTPGHWSLRLLNKLHDLR